MMGVIRTLDTGSTATGYRCRSVADALRFSATLWLILTISGCANSNQPESIAPPRPTRPDAGPWFVDRAEKQNLIAVTLCGTLRKLCVTDAMGSGVALFDMDHDGDLDIYITPCSNIEFDKIACVNGPWLFRNDGSQGWQDVTRESGLSYTGWAQAVAVADYDADGDLDLFVAHLGPDKLWQNQGNGRFLDVTEAAGLSSEDLWGIGATWGDIDGDGWLDLYVTNYLDVDPRHPPSPLEYQPGIPVFAGPTTRNGRPDKLWRNLGNGRFVDAGSEYGLNRSEGKGMAAVFADFDNDGRPDLFVTNDTQANDYFRNHEGKTFIDESTASGLAVNGRGMPEGSMGVGVADIDNDGLLDLAYANFRHEGTRIYRNLGGHRFQDLSSDSYVNVNTQRFVGWSVVLADFDDDGLPDLFQSNGHVYPNVTDSDYRQPPIFMRNLGEFRFEKTTEIWGQDLETVARGGRSVAVGDIDNDGDLDLVMTVMDGPFTVLINEGTRTNHTSNVQLIGPKPNLEAVGARVELTAGGRTFHGQVHRSGGFLSAHDVRLHFGLGTADRITSLTVHWPGGTISRYEDLPVDCRLIIRHDDTEVRSIPFETNQAANNTSKVAKP